jgi:hypothetical protein
MLMVGLHSGNNFLLPTSLMGFDIAHLEPWLREFAMTQE